METQHILSFLTISFLVVLSPGPSMLFIIHQGLSQDRKRVVAGVSGLVVANVIWTTLCGIGVGALLQNSQELFFILKNIGAIYLIYLGLNSIMSRGSQLANPVNNLSLKSYMGIFIKGLLTSMSNPKALLFYMAFIPQFLTGDYSYPVEISILGSMNIGMIILVLTSYGLLANRISNKVSSSKFSKYMNKIIGTSFIAFGISLFRYEAS